jgi:hypothetical protein
MEHEVGCSTASAMHPQSQMLSQTHFMQQDFVNIGFYLVLIIIKVNKWML